MSTDRSPTSPHPGSDGNNQGNPEPAQNTNDSVENSAANSNTTAPTAGSTSTPGVRTAATCVTKKPSESSPSEKASKRLLQELKELQNSPVEGVAYVKPREDDLFHWDVAFFGAPDTPYEGGYFKVRSYVY